MLGKLSELAEQTASSVSRRQFLGRLGRRALACALAAGALLSFPDDTQAAPKACGLESDIYCRGLAAGAYCQIGTTPGTCVGAPSCYCRPSPPRRGGRRR
jgi:hypothetical protein